VKTTTKIALLLIAFSVAGVGAMLIVYAIAQALGPRL